MPFLRLFNDNKNKIISIVNSLRTRLNILMQLKPVKRASFFASSKLKASMSVEAAFVLPLFMFFIIQVMSAINMIGIQSRLSAALHQTGNKMAFAGYAYEKAAGNLSVDGIVSVALTELYAKNQIIDYVGKGMLDKSCVKNGAAGLRFTGTSIMEEDDIIEIRISYYVEPLFKILGFDGFLMNQRYYGRGWTGYDVLDGIENFEENDPMVYITETGTVYHTNRDCTYLNLVITAVDAADIKNSRNQSGGKYFPCGICAKNAASGSVYITAQGSSYHKSINCSGLKRTIYTIPLSQAGGRRMCSKCR